MSEILPSDNPRKRRKAFNDADRRKIRRYAHEHPELKQKELAAWFSEESGHQLSQGKISSILSAKYEYLDTDIRSDKVLTSKRMVKGDFPALESALFDWQQRMQSKRAPITGDILRAKAKEIWLLLPQYANLNEPAWSSGWLEGFKARYDIKKYKFHGEAGAAAIDNPDAVEQMEKLRIKCKAYERRDILNMDETGLFWKLWPDQTLATKKQSGGKHAKDRITIAFTVSADGSTDYDPWFIGQSKSPRCFKHVNRYLLGVRYHYNKTKWMNTAIMLKYLKWLDNKVAVRRRKVLLLMDNFKAHECSVKLLKDEGGLRNIEVDWLPPNTTSRWQPLDQGIIASFKLQYKKFWIVYIVKQLDNDKTPQKTVTLLNAVNWTTAAWKAVNNTTVEKCWWKSTLVEKPNEIESSDQVDTSALWKELESQMASVPSFKESGAMTFKQFILPDEEELIEDADDTIEVIAEQYAEVEEEPEEVDGQEMVEKINIGDAVRALETLHTYEQQQEDGQVDILRKIQSIKSVVLERQRNQAVQSKITSFFTKTVT